jgi:hypothetical protein
MEKQIFTSCTQNDKETCDRFDSIALFFLAGPNDQLAIYIENVIDIPASSTWWG